MKTIHNGYHLNDDGEGFIMDRAGRYSPGNQSTLLTYQGSPDATREVRSDRFMPERGNQKANTPRKERQITEIEPSMLPLVRQAQPFDIEPHQTPQSVEPMTPQPDSLEKLHEMPDGIRLAQKAVEQELEKIEQEQEKVEQQKKKLKTQKQTKATQKKMKQLKKRGVELEKIGNELETTSKTLVEAGDEAENLYKDQKKAQQELKQMEQMTQLLKNLKPEKQGKEKLQQIQQCEQLFKGLDLEQTNPEMNESLEEMKEKLEILERLEIVEKKLQRLKVKKYMEQNPSIPHAQRTLATITER